MSGKPTYIFGKNAILQRLLLGRKIHQLLILRTIKNDPRVQQIIELAHDQKIPFRFIEEKALNQLTRTSSHQGIVAQTPPFHYVQVDEILHLAEARGEAPFIVMMDGIEDPHNMGAIIRTAAAAGAHGVIIPNKRQVEVNSTVIKVSTGAVENILIARVANLVTTVKNLKERGLWISGTHQDAKQVYTDLDFTDPSVVIIGAEDKGMNRLLREQCDFLARIPITPQINSLNASVAAGILLFKVQEKRGFPNAH